MSTIAVTNLKHESSVTDNISLTSGGNVGIGTSAGITTVSSGLAINNATAGNYPGLEIQTAGVTRMFFNANNAVSYISSVGTNPLVTYTNGTERMRITSSGEVLVGGTTEIGSASGTVTLERANTSPGLSFFRNDTSISSGNIFGGVNFIGNDTTSNTPTTHAYIYGVASGTHGAGDNPTDLTFGTTADGSSTVTERMRIDSSGNLGLGVTPSDSNLSGFIEGAYGTFGANSSLGISIGGNAYYNSGWKYKLSSNATLQLLDSGGIKWNVAPSGTAGNTISFTQAMTLTTDGNLGVGGTSPSARLYVAGANTSSGTLAIRVQDSTTADLFFIRNNGDGYLSGNLGIGTSSPNYALHITRPSGTATSVNLEQTAVYSWEIGMPASGAALLFKGSGSEKARIDSSGNLLVGGTTAYAPITSYTSTGPSVAYRNTFASAGKYWQTYVSTTNAIYIVNTAAASGVTMADGATSWSSYSDIRLKNITGNFDNALTDVEKLEPIKFTWKSDESNKPCVGITAQSVQNVLPEAVDELKLPNSEDDTEYLTVRYQEIVPLLVKAIQELSAKNDALEARIATLEAQA